MASRSQTVILKGGRGQNIKFLPYAFTEHGAIQAANVLNSPRAVLMGIHVVRAFAQLRDLLTSNKELAQKFAELERKVSTHDQAITGILKAIPRFSALCYRQVPPPSPSAAFAWPRADRCVLYTTARRNLAVPTRSCHCAAGGQPRRQNAAPFHLR